ncbi:MAG TPA: S53 family peptidase [Solirubrobacteraceae bacterium]|nr:S53 family peptidase [Solirubrobacteraceae bacterium]
MSSRSSFILRAFACAATLACCLGSAAVASARGDSWVATHTRALRLTGRLLGSAPAGAHLEISAVLPLRDAGSINGLIQSHQILTPAEVRARFSPTTASASAVARYLAAEGFQNVSVAGNRLLVTGYGTVAQAERAFHTSIASYRLNGRSVYANTAPVLAPAALHGEIAAVLGLSDVPIETPRLQQASSPDLSGFSPAAVDNAYDATSLPPASGTTTAIIASGDMSSTISDLRSAEAGWSKQLGINYPRVPVDVQYDGPQGGITTNNPLTGNLEWDLDTQISTLDAIAVKQLIIYDVATYTDPEVARGINMFVSQDRATALSASLGECDYIAFLDGAMLTTDEALAEGALQGQSMFASTGDNGYACPEVASTGAPEGPPGVSWPADGEYTTGVGGTTLIADDQGNVTDEIAWVGGGGGISPWETAAPWTLQANGAGQTWEFTNQGGRAVPDVAALADANTPYLVYQGNSTTGVGGTSVSSPLTMGLWARVQNVYGDGLGLAQYDFYSLYNAINPATAEGTPLGSIFVPNSSPGSVNGFRDIVLGTNGGCVAKPGYDYCTGIGSVQAAALAKALTSFAGQTHGPASPGGPPAGQAGGAAGSQGSGSAQAGGSSGSQSGSASTATRTNATVRAHATKPKPRARRKVKVSKKRRARHRVRRAPVRRAVKHRRR